MIKRYKRKNSSFMRRSSRIYLTSLNKGKEEKLKNFMHNYANVVRYFIEMFFSDKDFSSILPGKEITDRAVKRFGVTARLSQLASKQSKEIVNSQKHKSKRKQRMPLFRKITINIDQRFFKLEEFDGHFDWAVKFSSGIPAIVVPFNNTKHTLKFLNEGWILSNSIRFGVKGKKLFIDLIFEKERPPLKEEGKVLTIDLGSNSVMATNERRLYGQEIKEKIRKSGKRRKSFHYYVQTEANRIIKSLPFDYIKIIVLEKLKNVKKNTRGKFPRNTNRLLSFWHYARVTERLRQICEEKGIRIVFKDPWKTSQRCPSCGKIDRRNRSGERFKCIGCGFEENADIVGALNLEALWLAGAYSLRLL